MNWLHATILLLLDFVHDDPRGHNSSNEVFGDNTAAISINAMIAIGSDIYCDYRMQEKNSILVRWLLVMMYI
jgi:hypothetical protein